MYMSTRQLRLTTASRWQRIRQSRLTSHFNNIALHAIAISLSVADNALLQLVAQQTGTGSGGIASGSRIETINHPLPRSLNSRTNAEAEQHPEQ
jgi:hypothetical protein